MNAMSGGLLAAPPGFVCLVLPVLDAEGELADLLPTDALSVALGALRLERGDAHFGLFTCLGVELNSVVLVIDGQFECGVAFKPLAPRFVGRTRVVPRIWIAVVLVSSSFTMVASRPQSAAKPSGV